MYVKRVLAHVLSQDAFTGIKGQASRIVSQFCTWKKQCKEISGREEIDSQYIREGWSPGLVPAFKYRAVSGSDCQVQVSGGCIMPKALILGLMSRFDTDGRLVILKNPVL